MAECLMTRPHGDLTEAEKSYRAVASNIENLERARLISEAEKQTLIARARNLFLN